MADIFKAIRNAFTPSAQVDGPSKQNGRCGGCGGCNNCIPGMKSYDAAEAVSNFNKWNPPNRPAHEETRCERPLMVKRAKDLERNNEIVAGAHNTKLDMAMGSTYRVNPLPCPDTLNFSTEKEYADFKYFIRQLWRKQMYSQRKWCDSRGINDFDAQTRLFSHQYLNRGEALATIFRRSQPTIAPFLTVSSIIDTDRLHTPWNMQDNKEIEGQVVNEGVVSVANTARPIGYFIHPFHPMDVRSKNREGSPDFVSKFSRLGRQQVVHAFKAKQPHMVRGIMEMASCMKTLKCMDRYTTAQIETAILQSLIAFTVESDIPNAVNQILGAGGDGQTKNGVIDCIQKYQKFRNGYRDAGNEIKIDNTIVPHLLTGERMNMMSPTMPNPDMGQFFDVLFTYVARCFGMSKEYLTQDWSKTNYSGARAGMLVVFRSIEQFRREAPEIFACAYYTCWFEDNVLMGNIPLPGFPNPTDAWMYYVINRDSLGLCEFKGPAKDEIDRAKTAQQHLAEQQLGAYTLQRYGDEVLQQDWEDIARQQAIEEVRFNDIRAGFGLEPLPPGLIHRSSEISAQMIQNLNSPPEPVNNNDGANPNE